MSILGYARCSAADQNLDRQTDALGAAGCDRIFAEHMTGTRRDRPELAALLDYARPGDTLVVTELSRLGRRLSDLIDLAETLAERGIELRSLKEAIDTRTPTGKLVFHLLSSIAQFERDIIAERAAEGRAAAKARGRTGGRPRCDETKIEAARQLVAGGMSAMQAARSVGVSRASLYRHGVGTVAA
jgi:DNA invertase Pin-like site-specific DNA recombinase